MNLSLQYEKYNTNLGISGLQLLTFRSGVTVLHYTIFFRTINQHCLDSKRKSMLKIRGLFSIFIIFFIMNILLLFSILLLSTNHVSLFVKNVVLTFKHNMHTHLLKIVKIEKLLVANRTKLK